MTSRAGTRFVVTRIEIYSRLQKEKHDICKTTTCYTPEILPGQRFIFYSHLLPLFLFYINILPFLFNLGWSYSNATYRDLALPTQRHPPFVCKLLFFLYYTIKLCWTWRQFFCVFVVFCEKKLYGKSLLVNV